MADLESGYKTDRGHGNSTETAYFVEARFTYHEPKMIAGRLFDNRWRRVTFDEHPLGVPVAPEYLRLTIEHRYLGYSAAQALRWWLHASAEQEPGGGWCLETRLVEVRIKASHSIEAVATHALIGGEDRSSMMPNWGAKGAIVEGKT